MSDKIKAGIAAITENPGLKDVWVTSDLQCYRNAHAACEHEKSILGKSSLNSPEYPAHVNANVAMGFAQAEKDIEAAEAEGAKAPAEEVEVETEAAEAPAKEVKFKTKTK